MKNRIALTIGGLLITLAVAATARHLWAQDVSGSQVPATSSQENGANPPPGLEAAGAGEIGLDQLTVEGNPTQFNTSGRFGAEGPGGAGVIGPLSPDENLDATNPSLSAVRRRLDVLKAAYQRAPNDEERNAARVGIESYLVEYFDRDMKARQAELVAVKRRVEELDQLLQNRSQAKNTIIQSQLETTIREAQGLGFFREGGTGGAAADRTQLITEGN